MQVQKMSLKSEILCSSFHKKILIVLINVNNKDLNNCIFFIIYNTSFKTFISSLLEIAVFTTSPFGLIRT